MNTITKNTLALVAVTAMHVTFFAATARAGEVPVARVSYADLNLDSAAGAKALQQRIRVAAEQVCGDADSRQLDVAATARACLDQAIFNANKAMKIEQLTRTTR